MAKVIALGRMRARSARLEVYFQGVKENFMKVRLRGAQGLKLALWTQKTSQTARESTTQLL